MVEKVNFRRINAQRFQSLDNRFAIMLDNLGQAKVYKTERGGQPGRLLHTIAKPAFGKDSMDFSIYL